MHFEVKMKSHRSILQPKTEKTFMILQLLKSHNNVQDGRKVYTRLLTFIALKVNKVKEQLVGIKLAYDKDLLLKCSFRYLKNVINLPQI